MAVWVEHNRLSGQGHGEPERNSTAQVVHMKRTRGEQEGVMEAGGGKLQDVGRETATKSLNGKLDQSDGK